MQAVLKTYCTATNVEKNLNILSYFSSNINLEAEHIFGVFVPKCQEQNNLVAVAEGYHGNTVYMMKSVRMTGMANNILTLYFIISFI